MENTLKDKVVNQKINGLLMEDYLAQLCEQIENDKIEKVKSEDMISTLKQLNNRHKHLIDIQRNDLKEKQLEFQEFVYNKGKN